MSNQEFHGPVDQVAGRDIINMASQMLWDCDPPELRKEFRRCRAKLWQMRRDLFLNVPFIWFLAGALGSIWLLLSGTWFRIAAPIWMFVWFVGALMLPSLWLGLIRQRKGKMVAYYRRRLEIIDTALQDKS